MRDRRQYECSYCGEIRPATRDHVPPKAIYVRPLPANCPSVNACEECNSTASSDDEYFAHTIFKEQGVAEQSIAQPQIQKMIRALRMPEKKRYLDETMKALQLVEVRTKGGIVLGERPMIRVRNAIMDRAARRYVRGLYRFEKGVRLPSDTPLRVLTDPAMVNEMGPKLIKLVEQYGTSRIVQQGVFAYHFAERLDPPIAVWILLFYEAYAVVGLIGSFPTPADA